MGWALLEIRWIGAPPVARTLAVMCRAMLAWDAPESITSDFYAPVTLDADGLLALWHKPIMTVPAIVRCLGECHPVKARMVPVEPVEADREERARERLAATPWTTPADVGATDAAGRVRGHPGGGNAYGARGMGHAQSKRRGR